MRFSLCLVLLATVANAETDVSLMDMVPGVAQVKSLFQLVFGDTDGAVKTQTNFLNEGLLTSQLRSAYFLATGESKKAGDIQLKFLENMEDLVDGLPVIGHAKGIYHFLKKETNKGWEAIKSSTSSVGTVMGAIVGGPVGALGGHALTDLVITGVDALARGNESQPHGIVRYVTNLDHVDAGGHFDAITGLVLDAAGGKVVSPKTGKYQVLELQTGVVERHGGVPEVSNAGAIKKTVLTEPIEYHVPPNSPISTKKFGHRAGVKATGAKSGKYEEVLELQPQQFGDLPESNNIVQKKLGSGRVQFRLQRLTDPTKLTNELNFVDYRKGEQFRWFVSYDVLYGPLDLMVEETTKRWTQNSLKELSPYLQDNFIKNIDKETLLNKLSYLTAEHKQLIDNSDFRLTNTLPDRVDNCVGCVVGGVLKMDVKTLEHDVLKLSPEQLNSRAKLSEYLDDCKSKNLLNYESSGQLYNSHGIEKFLKLNREYLKNKHLILEKSVKDNSVSRYSSVLKYAMVNRDGNLQPTMLLIDFQRIPMVNPELPNPFRFVPWVMSYIYDEFEIFIITPK